MQRFAGQFATHLPFVQVSHLPQSVFAVHFRFFLHLLRQRRRLRFVFFFLHFFRQLFASASSSKRPPRPRPRAAAATEPTALRVSAARFASEIVNWSRNHDP